MADQSDETLLALHGVTIAEMVELFDGDLKSAKDEATRLVNELSKVLESSKLPGLGAQIALVACFAGGVVAQHCREAERDAKGDGIDPEDVPFIIASTFGTLLNIYLQQFFEGIKIPPLKTN